MGDTHQGACFCGAVTVEVTGRAVAEGFCHCADCRKWSAAPVTAYALFPAGQVSVTVGEDKLARFNRDGKAERVHCGVCGGAVMTVIEAAGLIDVYPPVLSGYPFTPAAHVHYGARMIDMKDGLPKFRDMPDTAGGSGEMIAD